MKKILLVAASTLAFSGAAHADHNYAGIKLGWVAADSKTKSQYDFATNSPNQAESKMSNKKSLTDMSGVQGTLTIGKAFSMGDGDLLLDASISKDSTDAKYSKINTYRTGVGIITTRERTVNVSMRRLFTLGFSVGYSKKIFRDVSGHAKLSLLVSRMQVKQSDTERRAIGAAPLTSTGYNFTHTSKKFLLGLSPTFGLSKDLGQGMSLSLDYSFSMYQNLTYKNSVGIQPGVTNSSDFRIKIRPTYHSVMLGVTKKF